MTLCSYCRKARAVHQDHIFSKALRRRFPDWENITVPACYHCNMIRGTRRLLPPSWADREAELEELTGRCWFVWNGEPMGAETVLR